LSFLHQKVSDVSQSHNSNIFNIQQLRKNRQQKMKIFQKKKGFITAQHKPSWPEEQLNHKK